VLTPAELRTIEQRLSVERLAPYRASTSGDLVRAVALDEWNREVAAAFGATLGDLEVAIRNAMHDELTAWSARKLDEQRWYLASGRSLPMARLAGPDHTTVSSSVTRSATGVP